MSNQVTPIESGIKPEPKALQFFTYALRRMVYISAGIAGLGLLSMMGITCVDVILRKLGHPFAGAYDLVKIAAAVTIACALPYTTAIKGHVAVEFFYHRMGPRGRVAADTLIRLIIVALFGLFTWQLFQYGARMRSSGQVSLTLQLPIFWVPCVMGAACALVVLVTLYHMLHPGKALIKL
jgi:TRAP-type C4-dicarboxylate transport system permease small subunit